MDGGFLTLPLPQYWQLYICSNNWFVLETLVFIQSYSEPAIAHNMNGINICKKIVVL